MKKLYRTRPRDHILIEENKSGIFECAYADMFSVCSWIWTAGDSKQSANRRNKNNYFQTTDQNSEKGGDAGPCSVSGWELRSCKPSDAAK